MTPTELTAWRKRLGLTKGEAAKALGLSPNGYGAYERGWIDVSKRQIQGWTMKKRENRPIPIHVELACERLEQLATAHP